MSPVDEARLFAQYLISKGTDRTAAALYARAMQVRPIDDDGDAASRFVRKHPWALGPIDAYLAYAHPDAPLRKKLYIMSAILETQPQHAQQFLSIERSRLYVIVALFFAVRAMIKLMAGYAIARFIQ